MKNTVLFGLLMGLQLTVVDAKAESPLGSSAGANVESFYESLTPYGEWIEIESGSYAWRPLRIREGWRPYVAGRWAWTDYGWYWISEEPFGWAVYHYGRWYDDDFYGWIWIPGDVWGPAWVEWRYNDDYIGWAPLPPYAHFSVSIGIRYTTRWIAPVHYWTFIHCRYFTSPFITRYAVGGDYARRLIHTTRYSNVYDMDRDRIINRGVDRGFLERRGFTRIDRTEITEARDGSGERERIVRGDGRERIEVYRPNGSDLRHFPERIEARRGERRTTLDLNRIERPGREATGQESRRTGMERRPAGEVRPSERRVDPQRREGIRRDVRPDSPNDQRFQRREQNMNQRGPRMDRPAPGTKQENRGGPPQRDQSRRDGRTRGRD